MGLRRKRPPKVGPTECHRGLSPRWAVRATVAWRPRAPTAMDRRGRAACLAQKAHTVALRPRGPAVLGFPARVHHARVVARRPRGPLAWPAGLEAQLGKGRRGGPGFGAEPQYAPQGKALGPSGPSAQLVALGRRPSAQLGRQQLRRTNPPGASDLGRPAGGSKACPKNEKGEEEAEGLRLPT